MDNRNPSVTYRRRSYITIRSLRFGYEDSEVLIGGSPYLRRRILYFGLGTLRLHKFLSGDDARAPHDHPWWFWTFPLSDYVELTPSYEGMLEVRTVRRFRFHFRPAEYQHIVLQPLAPFYTLVLTGRVQNVWGFYPSPRKFVPYWKWR